MVIAQVGGEKLEAGLRKLGLADLPWAPVHSGLSSFMTLESDRWFLQMRTPKSAEKLVAASNWLSSGPDILSGSAVQVVMSSEQAVWLLSARIGTKETSERYNQKTSWEKLVDAWPDITRTIEALEGLRDAPYEVMKPPTFCGVSTLREGPIEQKIMIAESIGLHVDQVRGIPSTFPLGRFGVYHSDLHTLNMVPSKSHFLAVDWEKLAVHPIITEVCCGLTSYLISEFDLDVWPERIEMMLPDIQNICEMKRDEVLSGVFWMMVAKFINRYKSMPPSTFSEGGHAERSLQLIADMR